MASSMTVESCIRCHSWTVSQAWRACITWTRWVHLTKKCGWKFNVMWKFQLWLDARRIDYVAVKDFFKSVYVCQSYWRKWNWSNFRYTE